MNGPWIDAARTQLSQHAAVVRVTVTGSRGSAPRDAGASLLIDPWGTLGTIGGGHLEWHATAIARRMLGELHGAPLRIADFTLGAQLGQCCGGRVGLWLERLGRDDLAWLEPAQDRALISDAADGHTMHRWQRGHFVGAATHLTRHEHGGATLFESFGRARTALWIFGAGHVGQALVRLLAGLGLFEITWIDPRAERLPADLPEGVTPQVSAMPAEVVAGAPAGTHFIVLTHDHALDYAVCRAALARTDLAWLGLIGSLSKAARFRGRLQREGVAASTIAHLTCPIGIAGVASKLPAAIAIAIAAQLLQQPVDGVLRVRHSRHWRGGGRALRCRLHPLCRTAKDIGVSSFALDFLGLLGRWAHLITGIAWIGASFYFVWLDNHLLPPTEEALQRKGVGGELWAVHGGGFYNAQKYRVAPPSLPPSLHWFYWEAYSTWLSGFILLALLYYGQAQIYLIDPAVAHLSKGGAILVSLALLGGSWLTYDGALQERAFATAARARRGDRRLGRRRRLCGVPPL